MWVTSSLVEVRETKSDINCWELHLLLIGFSSPFKAGNSRCVCGGGMKKKKKRTYYFSDHVFHEFPFFYFDLLLTVGRFFLLGS